MKVVIAADDASCRRRAAPAHRRPVDIRHGIVIITKTDRATPGANSKTCGQRAPAGRHFAAGADMLPVSAATGIGLDATRSSQLSGAAAS
jgi:hypothetical protein